MSAASKSTIQVYVRKGEDDERLLSFRLPDDLSSRDVIEHGFALDGNTAIRSVPRTAASGGSFAERLFAAQQDVVHWLEGLGYTCEFK